MGRKQGRTAELSKDVGDVVADVARQVARPAELVDTATAEVGRRGSRLVKGMLIAGVLAVGVVVAKRLFAAGGSPSSQPRR